MLKPITGIFAATVLVAVLTTGFAVGISGPADAASCTGSLNTCASRCRRDNPADKNCVSDHCTPKFQTCKSTGCWQQGGNYGNVLTCNLDRR